MCALDGQFSVAERSERLRLVSLASGSSGNAMLVQCDQVAGLIDCGIGPNRLRSELLAFGLRPSDLSFVYITHEHSDHIRAVPALTRAGVPVVTGSGTARALGLSNEWLNIAHGKRFACGGIEVTAVRTSHDAAEPLGAVVRFGGMTVAVFTDMGSWDDATVDAMTEANIIVAEANHNIDMLKRGPYPAHLKRRVLSDLGHLSNDECGRLTDTVRSRSVTNPAIYLAHLSEINNTPARAVSDVAMSGGWIRDGLTPLPRSRVLDLLTGAPAMRPAQRPLFQIGGDPGV